MMPTIRIVIMQSASRFLCQFALLNSLKLSHDFTFKAPDCVPAQGSVNVTFVFFKMLKEHLGSVFDLGTGEKSQQEITF